MATDVLAIKTKTTVIEDSRRLLQILSNSGDEERRIRGLVQEKYFFQKQKLRST
jgi:hypothetical protein